jgi:hypothetical protein
VNGGWLPSGHPDIPASTPPPSPPPPPPPPLALSNACATRDPFFGLRSGFFTLYGVCVDNGWVPIGHPLTFEYLARPLPIDYSGTYTLTILIDDCSVAIPDVVKRRVYTRTWYRAVPH